MSTITIKGHLVGYHFDHMAPDAISWGFCEFHETTAQSEHTVIAIPHEFAAEVPDKVDIVAGLVRGLEAAKVKALNDYQQTVATINRRLSELQAIECTVTP